MFFRFFTIGGFPGVIGALDGTHVAIFPPEAEREYLFINRKLYHSLNVLVVSIKIFYAETYIKNIQYNYRLLFI